MLRKKSLIIVTLIIMMLALPITALAAFAENNFYTLYVPDSGEICDPAFVLTTVAKAGYTTDHVVYRFGYEYPAGTWIFLPQQTMAGELNVTFPYDDVPDGALAYGITVAAWGTDGVFWGQLAKKWTCTPPTPPPPDFNWCSPGYFRNHHESWVGYSPSDDFDTTFGVDYFNPDITLGQAIELGGGGVNAIARLGTAALLSAAHPDINFALTVAQVIYYVQTMDQAAIEAAIVEDSCPLD